MKKLLALLIACTTITCAFASCGDKEEDSSSSSTSVAESSETETTTEEVTETTTESETEAETDTDETSTEEIETSAVEKTTHEYIEDADKTPFVGKWECEKLIVEGEELTDVMGLPLYAVFQLEIKEDGTAMMAEAVAELSDSEEAVTYTWGVIGDNEIEIVDENSNAMTLTLSDNYLVGTEEGYDEQLYLAKVDEFTPFDFESFMNDLQESVSTESASGDVETETVESTEITETVKTTSSIVLNTSTMKAHDSECVDVEKIAPENREDYNGTIDELKDMGYSPCEHCKLWS